MVGQCTALWIILVRDHATAGKGVLYTFPDLHSGECGWCRAVPLELAIAKQPENSVPSIIQSLDSTNLVSLGDTAAGRLHNWFLQST